MRRSNEYVSVYGEVRLVTKTRNHVEDVVDNSRMGVFDMTPEKWVIKPSPLCVLCWDPADVERRKAIWCACTP